MCVILEQLKNVGPVSRAKQEFRSIFGASHMVSMIFKPSNTRIFVSAIDKLASNIKNENKARQNKIFARENFNMQGLYY